MSNTVLDNSNISVHLGQTSQYKDQYDKSLLVREPRSNNRKHLNIHDDKLPFKGFDVWNAYEVSGLTTGGLPVAGIAKCVYPCDSKYIVESKSIKLYFNSFNMYKCADTPAGVLEYITTQAEKDLSELLETHVCVHVAPSHVKDPGEPLFQGDRYKTLENLIDQEILSDMNVDTYSETPELLEIDEMSAHAGATTVSTKYHSGLLKSNCRVTSQPDWGDIWVHVEGHQHVTPESLLRYIVSFRDECHFHEEICETVYKRLHDVLQPSRLAVTCLYARRGGIDINPTRVSDLGMLNKVLVDHHSLHVKTGKQ